MEMLVVMSVMIIIGGIGIYAITGLRDAVVVGQDVANLKLDVQRAQHASMLLQKQPGDNWVYGIGIDFSTLPEDGTYKFVKWISGSTEFNSSTMSSELLAFDDSNDSYRIDNPPTNAILPVQSLSNLEGFENVSLKAGYNVTLKESTMDEPMEISYVIFEAVTGRAFLYDTLGNPVNYSHNLTSGELEYSNEDKLVIEISRNQGSKTDVISISPGSGNINHEIKDGE